MPSQTRALLEGLSVTLVKEYEDPTLGDPVPDRAFLQVATVPSVCFSTYGNFVFIFYYYSPVDPSTYVIVIVSFALTVQ